MGGVSSLSFKESAVARRSLSHLIASAPRETFQISTNSWSISERFYFFLGGGVLFLVFFFQAKILQAQVERYQTNQDLATWHVCFWLKRPFMLSQFTKSAEYWVCHHIFSREVSLRWVSLVLLFTSVFFQANMGHSEMRIFTFYTPSYCQVYFQIQNILREHCVNPTLNNKEVTLNFYFTWQIFFS